MVNYNQVTYIAAWIVIVWCILFIIAIVLGAVMLVIREDLQECEERAKANKTNKKSKKARKKPISVRNEQFLVDDQGLEADLRG